MKAGRAPSRMFAGTASATVLGAVLLLAGWALGTFDMFGTFGMQGTQRAWLAAWLAAWWCAAGLVMGACANLWIHALTGGRWGAVLRPAAAALVARRAWLGPLFLPVALGLAALYPWAGDPATAFATLHEPAFARAWLSVPAFALRCVCYGALWFWLSGSALKPSLTRGRAAASLLLYGLSGSLASVDLLMSLVPGWRSTGFGLLVLVSQALGGAAALVLWTAWHHPARLRAPVEPGPAGTPVGRDLGNLLLMYVMVWGYLGFMQFLVIWAENLPEEISWFVPRLQTGWHGVGVALVALQLALPLLALVMRAVKDRPAWLGATAALVLAAHLLDAAWLVVPSVDAASLASWWLVPLCMAGMGLLLFAPMGRPGPAAAAAPGLEQEVPNAGA
jgi:hypothetical protein